MYLNDLLCIEAHIAGNKTYASGVVCVVVEEGVCLQQRGGDFARAPWYVIPGRGLHQIHGIGDHPARRLERRWAPRYSFRANLEIEWGSAVLRASTRDISASGMFIEAVDPLWLGAGFIARLTLDPPVRLDCFVKRVEPGHGMGVSVAVSESESQKLYHDLLSLLSNTGA